MPQTQLELKFESPTPDDAREVVKLVRDSGALDVNSDYTYLLMCQYFADTCLVARAEDKVVAFVTAMRPPQSPDVLFVWQIAVSAEYRGQRIARRLLDELTSKVQPNGVRYIEATVTPSNTASQRLFQSLAKANDTNCEVRPLFAAELFSDPKGHEPEDLFRVGPL